MLIGIEQAARCPRCGVWIVALGAFDIFHGKSLMGRRYGRSRQVVAGYAKFGFGFNQHEIVIGAVGIVALETITIGDRLMGQLFSESGFLRRMAAIAKLSALDIK